MPRTPAIFGISMASRKGRRWLVLLCYAALWTLILLVFSSISATARYILTIAMTFIGSSIQYVIFYKLAGDTVLPTQNGSEPHSLGLLRTSPSHKIKLDERQLAVRNAAYHKAYRIVAAYLLLVPVLFVGLISSPRMLLAIYTLSIYGVIYTLPQAIILWTEPDIPEEPI